VAAGYIGWRRAVAQEDGYRLERLDCPEIYEASPVLFGPKYGELYQVRGPDGEVVNEHVIRACQEEAVAVCTMMAEARGREGVSNG